MNRTVATTIYLILVASIVALDLWTKQVAFEFLEVECVRTEQGPALSPRRPAPHVVIADWFELEAVLNYGAFRGWFSGFPQLLQIISFVAVLATAAMVAVPRRTSAVLVIAFGLIAGGALGNLYDRIQIGAVRDFLKFFYVDGQGGAHVWPNFNLADSAICVGIGLVLLRELLASLRAKKETPAGAQEAAPEATGETKRTG